MTELLGHSGKDLIPPQSYQAHVDGVYNRATASALAATSHNPALQKTFLQVVQASAKGHDIGKLTVPNQRVLQGIDKAPYLPEAHFIHGAYLLGSHLGNIPSFVTASHHVPMGNFTDFYQCMDAYFTEILSNRDPTNAASKLKRIKQSLDELRLQHPKETQIDSADPLHLRSTPPTPSLFVRMALSCLVDGDHGDTATNYGNFYPAVTTLLRPQERLAQLDAYVASLPSSVRDKVRKSFYLQCRNHPPVQNMANCDGVTGVGKTTAVMSHMLRVTAEKNLRRIMTIAPYTSILSQTTNVYRCMTLPGEFYEDVFIEHHCKVDYLSPERKQYAVHWYAPFINTTAVQFFETLTSNRPSALGKLHNICRSAIFIDEAHASIPIWLWPLAIQLLRELQETWGCYVALVSGSMNKFWDIDEFQHRFEKNKYPKILVTNINSNESVRKAADCQEKSRIQYKSVPAKMSRFTFVDWMHTFPGPRLVIVNTTQIAAAIARMIANTRGRQHVEHLSTILSPLDRRVTEKRIKERLDNNEDHDWTLVSTSCCECGMNFDFRFGFRQRCSLSSLDQTGGRVNRDGKWTGSEVWDFDLSCDDLINIHPDFVVSADILFDFMKDHGNLVEQITTEDITNAARREFIKSPEKGKKADALMEAERRMKFKDVADKFKVIDSDTKTCIINHEIANCIRNSEYVHWNDVMLNAVQLWGNRIEKHGALLVENEAGEELYEWNLPYDNFLGCMAGILPQLDLGGDFAIL